MPTGNREGIPGSFVPIGSGREAFHPEMLPPDGDLGLDEEVHETIADATYELGRLDEISRSVDLGPVLFTSLVRMEAVESAAIEGADVEFDEVYQYHTTRDEGEPRVVERDLQEVLNYEQAVYEGVGAIDDGRGITVDLLHSLHGTLLAGSARADTEVVGDFRSGYVHLGEFIPPPSEKLDLLVENVLKYVENGGNYQFLVDLALAHYQFETIHPYEDGNGRLGRLLVTLRLYDMGVIAKPYVYPSAYVNRHKDEYVEGLQGVRYEGDWNTWVSFFVTALAEQAREANRRIRDLRDLRGEYEERYGDRRNATQRLALTLFETPYVTASEAMQRLDVSDGAVYQAIQELEADGVLEEVTGRNRNREYKATDIFAVIE